MVASTSDNGQTPTSATAVPASQGDRGPLSGDELFAAIAAAAEYSRASAAAVDAINVYPVPDGDTGTNMSATLREAVDTAALVPTPRSAQGLLEALAKGALYGARGNSGVILSQALAGLAKGVGEIADGLDAASLATGLEASSRAAYRAVSQPVEGTMLTVLREAAVAATEASAQLPGGGHGQPCLPLLRIATAAAQAAEARTIDQLPQLREAGVPDAGGEGICVILRGLVAALSGETPKAPSIPRQPIARLAGHASDQFGYCTEFVLEPTDGSLDIEGVRAWAESGNNRSVVVVGGEDALRVHVHTDDGRALIDAAAQFGRVSRAKIDDMSAQHGRFRVTGTGASSSVALLALSRGPGFDAMFESLGAAVADLGPVVKPPAGDIAAAVDSLGVPDVIVLPNHKDVVLAARQAAGLTRCTLHIVATKSLPQGLAAAVAFDTEASVAENLERLRDATTTVTTVEVTQAISDRVVEGVVVRAGQAIALVDGKLRAACDSAIDVLVEGLRLAHADDGALITVFAGDAADDAQREAAPRVLHDAFPGAEVEFHDGGQTLYTFIASIER